MRDRIQFTRNFFEWLDATGQVDFPHQPSSYVKDEELTAEEFAQNLLATLKWVKLVKLKYKASEYLGEYLIQLDLEEKAAKRKQIDDYEETT